MDRCFLLSTNVELVRETIGMRPIAGRTSGFIDSEDQITWYGWKFGIPHLHESRITAYERPSFFQDTMLRGKFKRYQHDHILAAIGGLTMLNDRIRFSLPLGWVGDIVAKRVLVPYLSKMIRNRLRLLKRIAESDDWRDYLPDSLEAPIAH
jgi:ligand-binding SRPBCC domain-containing protein